jgi:hypothetical protein
MNLFMTMVINHFNYNMNIILMKAFEDIMVLIDRVD